MGITKPVIQPVVEGVVEGPQGKEHPVLNGVDQYFTIPLWDPGTDDHIITYGTDNDDGLIVPASGAVSEIGRVGADYHSGNIRWVSLQNITNPDQSRLYLGDERGRFREVMRGDGPELTGGDLSGFETGTFPEDVTINLESFTTAVGARGVIFELVAGKTYAVDLQGDSTVSFTVNITDGPRPLSSLTYFGAGFGRHIIKPTAAESWVYLRTDDGGTVNLDYLSIRETNDGLLNNLDATDWQPE